MVVEFLIATMDRQDVSFLHDMFYHTGLDKIHALIVNQCSTIEPPTFIDTPHEHIRMLSVRDEGLSKSRNMALRHSRGDVMVIADDDVVYQPQVLQIIIEAHRCYLQHGVLTFKAMLPRKHYASKTYTHNALSIMRVSSLEITFKKDVLERGVLFDERFGLGALYPLGEENIWLYDLLPTRIKMRYIPRCIVSHPRASTGRHYNKSTSVARGAVFYRIYGLIAFPLSAWFAIKKYRQFYHNHGIFTEIGYLWKGIMHYIQSK